MISENRTRLTWDQIIKILRNISVGLSIIHNQNYHHRDFHSGNILTRIDRLKRIDSVISEFGMCRPAGTVNDTILYGVVPFVAPEVLQGGNYTKAADIYGFGMIMWEIFSGEP